MADIAVDPFTWSSTAGNNSPAGSTVIGTGLDDNLRAIQAGVKSFVEPLSGVAGTNTVTATHATIATLTTGARFAFTPAATNTGATTLNINSIGAKNIFFNGAALIGGEMLISVPVTVQYDGTQFNLVGGAYPANTSTSTTFSDNGTGPGTSGSVSISTQIVGGYVFFNIPSFSLTSGTGSASINSNTALPASFRPANDVWLPCNTVRNSGAAVGGGVVRIISTGTIIIYRDGNLTAYTNASSCGLNNNFAGCYKL